MDRVLYRVGLAIALSCSVSACGGTSLPPTSPSPTPTNPPGPNSPDPLVGRYTLRVAFGASCESLPDVAKTRTYSATIDPAGPSAYVVTLSDATFLAGLICEAAPSRLGCNQFVASRTADLVRFDLFNENDDGHGGHIVEQIPPGTWLELIGHATGPVQDGTITATGSASAWYCPTTSAYPFPCRSFTSCRSDDLQLTFTRK